VRDRRVCNRHACVLTMLKRTAIEEVGPGASGLVVDVAGAVEDAPERASEARRRGWLV